MIEAILAAVIPAAIDLVKTAGGAVSRRFFGMNVDDQIKLMQAETDKLRAIAELDSPHGMQPSLWVINLRQSFRYIAALVIITIGAVMAYLARGDADTVQSSLSLMTLPFSFIFGERYVMGLKGGKR